MPDMQYPDEPVWTRSTPEHRYLHDPVFRQIVDSLVHLLDQAGTTPTEIREAAMLAQIHYEERQTRRYVMNEAEARDMDARVRQAMREDPHAWRIPDDRHGVWQVPVPTTLATLSVRLDALSSFVGLDPASHVPLDECVTIDERLRTIGTAIELMQGRLDVVLALLKETRHA